jgi:hypothetical protein
MKRLGILLCIILVLSAAGIFAEESVLIDFSQLVGTGENKMNEATMIDFGDKAGTSFTQEEKDRMQTSLAIEEWSIELAPSSKTIENTKLSYTKEAVVKESATKFGGETLMGIRVHFPVEPFNSWAIVKPPFAIPAYAKIDENDLHGDKFVGYGIVKNVGVVKTISIQLQCKNFPNHVGIIIKDQNNVEQTLHFGHLEYDGWKTLTWKNPNYIADVRARELKKYPLYPHQVPMRQFVGLIFYKDAVNPGGDFITYVKDVTMTYDLATMTLEEDVDDEGLWGIMNERETSKREAEFERLGNLQVLRYLEGLKMHQDEAPAATK